MTAAALVATAGGLGRLPLAPGTWGSAVAALAAWPIMWSGGSVALLVAAVLLAPLAIWAAGRHGADLGVADPGEIVIDEVIGQWIALLAAAPSLFDFVAAFALFRAFDVIKPWPIRWVDRRLRGGWGVVADDVLAGLAAAGVLVLARWVMT
jgi:phosphatidylglycerophosphatase A